MNTDGQRENGVWLRGSTWWFAYSHRGREYKRSSRSTSRAVAERMLRAAVKKLGTGYNPDEERLSFEQMIDRVKLERRTGGNKCDDTEQRAAHLRPFFGAMRAPEISTEAVGRYVESRLEESARPATINRELALLRRAFVISEVSKRPRITLLTEDNARRDFLDFPDFCRVREGLGEFADFYSFLYFSSWRQGQVAALEWRDVDVGRGEVTARGATTKNGLPHRIPLTGELAEIVERARAARRLDCPFVFHRDGKPIALDGAKAPVRQVWARACAAAGFAGHVPHCLRRSGIRNMVRAGVDPTIAMAISGHRTAAVFQRYNITTIDDQRAALKRTMEYVTEQPAKVVGIR